MSANARGVVTRCEHCGSVTSEREICVDRGMTQALWKVFKWCKEKGVYEFETKDVIHLYSKTQYARFGDWVYFGGLVYKKQKAHYGLNMERCEEFFANKYAIPLRGWKNSVTGEFKPEERFFARSVPKLATFLDADGYYMANYRESHT